MNRKLISLFVVAFVSLVLADPIIIDHNCTDLTQVPQSAIQQAKDALVIAYGHTSHGSQLTTGMSAMTAFINGGGLGISAPTDFYSYNSTGSGGALQLRDTPFSGASDLGNPNRTAWEAATRTYLDAHPEVNVIIWSWCGQVDGSEADIDLYLSLMSGLEITYPNVHFVYMTGHLNGTGETGNVNIRNQQIRDYCTANDKILYDFADIESYDPDGLVNYMELFCNDNCDYDSDDNGSRDKNWAIDWQNSHTEDVDWYSCSAAHSQPLNGNRKAYAAWWLWARLAGWMQTQCVEAPSDLTADYNDVTGRVTLKWTDNSDDPAEDAFIIRRQVDANAWDPNYAVVGPNVTTFSEILTADGTYRYRVAAWLYNDGNECTSDSSNTATIVIANTPPDAPSGLSADLNNNDIILTWSDNSDNEQVFILERRVDEGSFAVLDDAIAANSESYIDQYLETEHTYYYRIFARNTNGDSAYSNTVSQYVPYSQQIIRLESTSEVEDSFIFSIEPNTNYGSSAYPPRDIERYIFKFNFPPELEGKRILSAELSFYLWSQNINEQDQYMDLYRVVRDWDESTVTWNDANSSVAWTAPGGDYDKLVALVPLDANTPDHGYIDPPIDITLIVQDWVRNKVDNFGLLLVNESLNETNLKASEYSSGHTRLDITYTDGCPCGFSADIDYDCAVNLFDFAELGYYYMSSEPALDIAPVPGDGIVDYNDLQEFTAQWLGICP